MRHFYTQLTEELVDKIGAAIEAPNHTAAALAMLGVSRSAFYKWLRRGLLAPDSIYGALRRRVQIAEANREAGLMQLVYVGARKDARWAAWLLERLYPNRYGAYSMPDEMPDDENVTLQIDMQLDGLTDDELEILEQAARILARLGEAAGSEAIPAEAREAETDPVHALHDGRRTETIDLSAKLAPPFDGGEVGGDSEG